MKAICLMLAGFAVFGTAVRADDFTDQQDAAAGRYESTVGAAAVRDFYRRHPELRSDGEAVRPETRSGTHQDTDARSLHRKTFGSDEGEAWGTR